MEEPVVFGGISRLHSTFYCYFFFFSSRRRHTRFDCDWSSDVCSSDLALESPVNVSVYPYRNSVLAFGEQGLPWELDPVTLETLGEYNFGGAVNDISQIGRASCRERV